MKTFSHSLRDKSHEWLVIKVAKEAGTMARLYSWCSAGFLSIRGNVLTVGEKFRTGGSTTMRDFQYNTVVPGDDPISIFFGGDSVLILNEEIRFPIHKCLSGATFLDIGNVYLHVFDFDPTNLRCSAD